VRGAYAPENSKSGDEQLRLSEAYGPNPYAAPDGVFITARHLWAIAIGMATKRKAPISAQEIGEYLFYPAERPDVRTAFDSLMATYDPSNAWWETMAQHGGWDSVGGMIVPS
jgi:hypothetical protein